MAVDARFLASSRLPANCLATRQALPGRHGGTLGCFRAADGGSLYLGQVEMLPLEFQPQMLEALITRRVTPLGAVESVGVDVRLICSSLCDLQKEIQHRHLMPELYTQLDAVSLRTLPLSARSEDIEPLARHFLAEVAEDYAQPPRRARRGRGGG